MKRTSCWIFLLFTIFTFPVVAQENDLETTDIAPPKAAETEEVQEVKYVTDKLRLSLYSSASSNSNTLKLLSSGDELDVLARKGPYSRVRTSEGLIGWVKNGFLVSTPTDSLLLIDEQKKNEILTQQLEQYADTQKLVQDYENTINLMKSDNEETLQQLQQSNEAQQQLDEKNAQLEQKIKAMQRDSFQLSDIILLLKQYWYAVAILVLSLFLVGFVTGRVMVEAQVKRRFQGVKVW